jgi:hypothetical protein
MAERCDACRLWRRLTEDSGECRALPPRPTAPCGLKISAVWPLTLAAEWCGGWRPYPVAHVTGPAAPPPPAPGGGQTP